MAKYLQNSSDISIEEVSGTENIQFNFASNNSLDQKIDNLILSTPEITSDTTGTYFKFKNGFLVCVGRIDIAVPAWNAWGNGYSYDASVTINFTIPFETDDDVYVFASASGDTSIANSYTANIHGTVFNKNGITKILLNRPSSASNNSRVIVSYLAIGRYEEE